MKTRRAIAAFLAVLCVLNLLNIHAPGAHAAGANTITATTEAAKQQGDYGYAHVYIGDLADLASLTVAVHYDPEKIRVVEVINQAACELYDSSDQGDCLQFSYIFDGEGSTGQAELFYFRYQVLDTAATGTAFFDILVGDACDANLRDMEIQGSRCSFRITEKTTVKTCNVSATGTVSTSVNQEFTIDYRLSNTQVASGSFVITYDPELFACVGWTSGKLLENMLTDVNTGLTGAVYISFAGTGYAADANLGSITFRTLKNETANAQIQIIPQMLCDLNLMPVVGTGSATRVGITYDADAVEPSASMVAQATYDPDTEQITVVVRLGEGSHLGAGDFRLEFDTDYLRLNSLQKEFNPNYFIINDKKAQEGLVKFSLISLTDITSAETVLTAVFDTIRGCSEQEVTFGILGSGLTNSLTDPIALRLVSARATIPEKHSFTSDCDEGCNLCDYTRVGGEHTLEHHAGRAETCTEIGWKDYNTCQFCDYSNYVEIPATGHNYIATVTPPTCTTGGYTTQTCGNCYGSYVSDSTEPLYIDGHSFENGQCRECGLADGALESGSCGERVFWSYYESGKLVIYGRGAMATYSNSSQPWVGYRNRITAVEVRRGVTDISANAFYMHASLRNVTLPEGLTSLGNAAFYQCYTLESVILPDTLETIGRRCFYSCYALKEIRLPDTVSSIGNQAFAAETRIFCHENTTAHSYAQNSGYLFCAAPAGAALEHNYIGGVAGPGCTEQGYTTHTCSYCSHSYVDSYVDALGHSYGEWHQTLAPDCVLPGQEQRDCIRCDHFESRSVPSVEHSIVDGICTMCGISDGYSDSGQCGQTLYWCYYDTGKLVIYGQGTMDSWFTDSQPWVAHKDQITEVEVRSGVTSIGNYAFYDYGLINKISLPQGLTALGSSVFSFCDSLETVEIPDTVCSLGTRCFSYANGLKHIEIPASITSLSYSMFGNCSALEEVILPDTLTGISTNAFQYCRSLREIRIPDGVTTIGSDAFPAETRILCHENTTAHSYAVTNSNPFCAAPANMAIGHIHTASVTAPTCTEQGYTTHTCSRCGHSYVDSYVNALGHSYGDWYQTLAPTCTEKGKERHDCIRCDHFEEQSVAAAGHSYTASVTAPTCTEKGFTTHTCHCGHSYVDSYVNALGHSYGDWYQTLAPTCTEQGMERHDCIRCDHFEEQSVAAAGHSYTASVTAPSCTEKGFTTHTCHCGHSYVDSYVNALGHSYGDWYQTLAPTCTEQGKERHDCTRCDHFEEQPVPAAGHSYTASVTAPSCTEKGFTTHTCHCGHSYVDSYVNALGHSYCDWYQTLAPTCTEQGMERHDCTRCGHEDSRSTAPLYNSGHSMENGVCTACGIAAGELATGQCGDSVFWNYYSGGKLVIYGKGATDTFGDDTQPWAAYKSEITAVEVRSGVTAIGNRAFYDHTELQRVNLPEGLESLGYCAFWWCKKLPEVEIPDTVTRIEGFCFTGCYALKKVVLPQSLTNLDSYAFYCCYGLEEVVLPDTLETIHKQCFAWCPDLTTIQIPESVTAIESNALYGCNRLTELAVPDSVTTIGQDAFSETTRILCHEGSAAHTYAQAAGNPCCAAPAGAPLGHDWQYLDNSDGTHDKTCRICAMLAEDSTPHAFDDGSCCCGAEEPAGVLGDLNLDGLVNSDDLTLLARHVGGIELVEGAALANCDVNGDGQVNSDDLTRHARYVGGIISEWGED